MRPSSFPDPKRIPLQAGIFTSDLQSKTDELFAVFAPQAVADEVNGVSCQVLRLPITIPFDEHDIVLLGPANLDCIKKPATLELVRFDEGRGRRRRHRHRPPYAFGIGIALLEGGPLHIPGVNRRGVETEPPEPVHELTFAASDKGFATVGYDAGGTPLDLRMTEYTAGLLANALVITLGVKLAKAERGIT